MSWWWWWGGGWGVKVILVMFLSWLRVLHGVVFVSFVTAHPGKYTEEKKVFLIPHSMIVVYMNYRT